MSQVCEDCGKKVGRGRFVSHSHIRTKRTFLPNLQKKTLFDPKTKQMVRKKICTKCIKTYMKKVESVS